MEGVEDFYARHRRDALWKLAAHWLQRHEVVNIEGVVQFRTSSLCWLRSRANDYTPAEDDIFVLPSIVERFGLLEGMTVKGRLRAPREGEGYLCLHDVDSIDEHPTEDAQGRALFKEFVPIYQIRRLSPRPVSLHSRRSSDRAQRSHPRLRGQPRRDRHPS